VGASRRCAPRAGAAVVRESAIEKGKRYVAEGRLIVRELHEGDGIALADCRGDGAVWSLGRDQRGCGARALRVADARTCMRSVSSARSSRERFAHDPVRRARTRRAGLRERPTPPPSGRAVRRPRSSRRTRRC
jgi:hypothetical protein